MNFFNNFFGSKKIDIEEISKSVLQTMNVAESSVILYESLKSVKINLDPRYDRIITAYIYGLVDLYNTAHGVKKILSDTELNNHYKEMTTFCIIQNHVYKLKDKEKYLKSQTDDHQKKIDEKISFFKSNIGPEDFQTVANKGYDFGKFFYQNNGEIIGTPFAFDLPKILDDPNINFDK